MSTTISTISPGLAETYDATKTYAKGAYVLWQNAYWKCKDGITSAEAWTASHWTKVAKVLDGIEESINGKLDTESVSDTHIKWNDDTPEMLDIASANIVLSGNDLAVSGSLIAGGFHTTYGEGNITLHDGSVIEIPTCSGTIALLDDIPEVVAPDSSDGFISTDGRAASVGRVRKELDKKLDLDSNHGFGFTSEDDPAIRNNNSASIFFSTHTGSDYKWSSLFPDGSPVLTSKLLTGEDGKTTTNQIKTSLFSDIANTLIGYQEYKKQAYSLGAVVVHEGKLWACTEDISEGGEEWNADHWTVVKEKYIFLCQRGDGSLESLTVNALNIPTGFVTGKSGASIILPESTGDVTLATTGDTAAVRAESAESTWFGDGRLIIPFPDNSRLYVKAEGSGNIVAVSQVKYVSLNGSVIVEDSTKKALPVAYNDSDGNQVLGIYKKGSYTAFSSVTNACTVLVSTSAINAEKMYAISTPPKRPADMASALTPVAFDILTGVYNDKYLAKNNVVPPDSSAEENQAADASDTYAALAERADALSFSPNYITATKGGNELAVEISSISENGDVSILVEDSDGQSHVYTIAADRKTAKLDYGETVFTITDISGYGAHPDATYVYAKDILLDFTDTENGIDVHIDYYRSVAESAHELTPFGKQSLFSSDDFKSAVEACFDNGETEGF